MVETIGVRSWIWNGIRLYSIPAEKQVTKEEDPELYFTIPCIGSPQLSCKIRKALPRIMGAGGLGPMISMESARVLKTMYPPTPGMCCPIVVRCTCGHNPCLNSSRRAMEVADSMELLDFEGIQTIKWKDFPECWAQTGDHAWGIYNLPPVFALDMSYT